MAERPKDIIDWVMQLPDAEAILARIEGRQQLTPSADLPACRDEDPAQAAVLAACYPDPPDYPHPEDDQ